MSSMRNAVQRRSHRERAAPQDRRRLGLLEKHKDYALRAADHRAKQTTLRSLRQKAADRNEDEFFFGMLSRSGPSGARGTRGTDTGRRWDGTVAGQRGNSSLGVEAVRLLKTQDVGYVRTVRNVAAKEVQRLEERVVMAGGDIGRGREGERAGGRKPRKIVFLDGVEERERVMEGLEAGSNGEAGDSGDRDSDDGESDGDDKAQVLEKLQRRLANARTKLETLTDAENELEMQRARMAKTATVGGVTKKGKKFKIRERKR